MAEAEITDRVVAGRYRLIDQVGRGGMGAVWRARDEVLGREVAVKELITPPELVGPERETFAARTLQEARAAGRLSHPGVAAVYDVLEDGGHPWIVLELVPSRTLGSVVREGGPLPPRRVAQIGLQVLNALQAAHHAGVLHRDVKPDNVLLGEHGRAVLTDFGIATLDNESHLTRTGALIGTPAFIAPERAAGCPAASASDLWSLGATLYFAVEGASPFHRDSVLATLSAVLFDHPPLRAAGILAPVIAGLLRKDPAQRMTAEEAAVRLHAALSARLPPMGGSPVAPTPAAVPRTRPDVGRPEAVPAIPETRKPRIRPVAALAGAAVVLAGLVAGIVTHVTNAPARTDGSVVLAVVPPQPTATPTHSPTPAATHPGQTPTAGPAHKPGHQPAQRPNAKHGAASHTISEPSAGKGKGKGPGKQKGHEKHGASGKKK